MSWFPLVPVLEKYRYPDLARPLGDSAGLNEALAIGREFDARLDHHAELVRALPGGGDPHLALDVALGKAELSRLIGRSSRRSVGDRGGCSRRAAAPS
jgi:hypothetical protein